MRTALAIVCLILAALMFASGSVSAVIKAVLDFLGLA
jgi:hypothetical protein